MVPSGLRKFDAEVILQITLTKYGRALAAPVP